MQSGSIERQCCVVDGLTKVVQTKQYNYWKDCIDIWYQIRCPYDAGHLIWFVDYQIEHFICFRCFVLSHCLQNKP